MVGTDEQPIEFIAGVEVMCAVITDGLVNIQPKLLAGQFHKREVLTIPNEIADTLRRGQRI